MCSGRHCLNGVILTGLRAARLSLCHREIVMDDKQVAEQWGDYTAIVGADSSLGDFLVYLVIESGWLDNEAREVIELHLAVKKVEGAQNG